MRALCYPTEILSRRQHPVWVIPWHPVRLLPPSATFSGLELGDLLPWYPVCDWTAQNLTEFNEQKLTRPLIETVYAGLGP